MVKDRRRWTQWLFEAKKRYGLIILNYTITSNHIHLLVKDDKGRDVIPQSIKLIAGRTGQEYNLRKKRKGAFWEDRYHATAVDSKQHLMRCLVYIDLNMVRTGVIYHPSEWSFGGYNEIQTPRRKSVLIANKKLSELAGYEHYETFRKVHQESVDDALVNGKNRRQKEWTESIAVGNQDFITAIKEKFGAQAKGRKIIKESEVFQVREPSGSYNAVFDTKMEDIGAENSCFWNE